MPSIIIVEKVGSIKPVSMKSVVETELYKKAGLKTPDGFKCHTNWSVEYNKKQYTISLYGKTTGRANHENKYEFPPPADNTLFFGNCILIAKNTEGAIVDLTEDSWEKIYETLYGGFDDIDEDDSDSDCDSESEEIGKRTKNGYVKDGFVVDEEEDEDEDEDDADDTIEIPVKTKKSVKSTKPKKKTVFEKIETEEANVFLDCTSELKEELYD